MTRFTGVSADETISSFDNSIDNALNAVTNRVLSYTQNGERFLISEKLDKHSGPMSKYLSYELVKLANQDVVASPIPEKKFPGLYQGARNKIYARAEKSLSRDSLLKSKDWQISMFLKYEKDIRSVKPDAVPRVISPPGPRYRLKLGCYVKAVEEGIYEDINKMFGYHVVAKGMNYEQLGGVISEHWHSFSRPASIDLDVKRLDQAITVEMLVWAHQLILSKFVGSDRDELEFLLEKQLKSKVFAKCDDGFLTYKVVGTLTSGQPNTSLTGVSIVTSIIHAYSRKCGFRIRLINCGDDCTIICDEKYVKILSRDIQTWFKEFEFRTKVSQINYLLEGIEFCQTKPVYVNGHYQMVRDVRNAIIKDSTSIDLLDTPLLCSKWLQAVASGGLATHGGIPIFQEFYTCYARSSKYMIKRLLLNRRQRKNLNSRKELRSIEKSSMKYWGKGMNNKYVDHISPKTRYSFYLAFGYTPQEQVIFEKYYMNYVSVFIKPVESTPQFPVLLYEVAQ